MLDICRDNDALKNLIEIGKERTLGVMILKMSRKMDEQLTGFYVLQALN